MMKKLKWLISIAAMLLLAACGSTADESNETLKIYTTVYPLQYIIDEIGGDTVETESIIPPGADGHSYEPTAGEMLKYADGDAVIYVGKGMEAFSENIAEALSNQDVSLIKLGSSQALFNSRQETFKGHENEAADDFIEGVNEHYHTGDTVELSSNESREDIRWAVNNKNGTFENAGSGETFKTAAGEESFSIRASIFEQGEKVKEDIKDIKVDNHDSFDPHIWIDPLKMIEAAEILKEELIQLNEDDAEIFEENFNQLVQKLETLDGQFSDVLSDKKNGKIIVPHAAFGYWERYGIEQLPVSGYSMSEEPSQRQLATLMETAEKNHLKYVLFEQNSSGRISEVIQQEINAEAEYIHNMEVLTEENIDDEEDYISLMNKNLEVLDKVTE
ncbi:MAG: zinc ABC transporter solute-binding protein [Jeotgalicoccus halophilus]|mgnify:CR=1 FL=1|nr:zinc ABC transporter solute-binding protein [Jeotgalicoccus aerolatus]